MRKHIMRKRVWAVYVPLLVLVAVTGCSKGKTDDNNGVASVQGTAAPTAIASYGLSVLEQGRRHAQCMRSHGVPEADPRINPDGGVRVGGGYDKHTLDQGVLDQAIEACRQYEPVMSPEDLAKKLPGARELAKCMRDHGVEGYPDPDPNDLGKSLPDAVLDDPQYDTAKHACDTPQTSTTTAN